MVRFILNYLIFSVATIRVCKKIFSSAFNFDKSYIKNKLKESENHEDNHDFFSCKGVYKVSLHFPLLFLLGNVLILPCGEKRLSWKQWPGAWDSLIVGCGRKSLGLPKQPRLQDTRSWKGVPAEKQNWNCNLPLEIPVDSQAMFTLGEMMGMQTKSSSSKEQQEFWKPCDARKERLKGLWILQIFTWHPQRHRLNTKNKGKPEIN